MSEQDAEADIGDYFETIIASLQKLGYSLAEENLRLQAENAKLRGALEGAMAEAGITSGRMKDNIERGQRIISICQRALNERRW